MSGTAPPPSPPPSGWGQTNISVVTLGTFLAALAASGWMAWAMKDTASVSLFTALCGVAATNATTIVNYWVGSSSGSARKTEIEAAKP